MTTLMALNWFVSMGKCPAMCHFVSGRAGVMARRVIFFCVMFDSFALNCTDFVGMNGPQSKYLKWNVVLLDWAPKQLFNQRKKQQLSNELFHGMHTFTVLSYWYPHDLLIVVNGCKVKVNDGFLFGAYLNASNFHDVDCTKKNGWWKRNGLNGSHHTFYTNTVLLFHRIVSYSLWRGFCYFRRPFIKKMFGMHASAFHSRKLREYFAYPSGLVTSFSSWFLSIYPLGSLGGPWVFS